MVWFYAACYYILENNYELSKKPTSEDFEKRTWFQVPESSVCLWNFAKGKGKGD